MSVLDFGLLFADSRLALGTHVMVVFVGIKAWRAQSSLEQQWPSKLTSLRFDVASLDRRKVKRGCLFEKPLE